MGLLIRNGEVVTASDRFFADVRVDGGSISDLGSKLEPRAGDETIDASGQYVLPGFVDPHVHMELPFMGTVSVDDFEVGGASGAAGGTTCFIDFCMQGRGETLPAAIAAWHGKSKKSAIDYSYHVGITDFGPTRRPRCAKWSRSTASPASRCSSPTRARSWWTTASSTA
jgi:dihydropyrimidinase